MIGAGLSIFFLSEKLKHRFAPIDARFMPPPCYVFQIQHFLYASLFFRAVRFAFTGASAPAVSAVVFAAAFFDLAFTAFLFRELPKEPIAIFPFFVFLSPFPIFEKHYAAIITKGILIRKSPNKFCGDKTCHILLSFPNRLQVHGRKRKRTQSFGWFPWFTNRNHFTSLASSTMPHFCNTRMEAALSASTKVPIR